MFEGPKRGGCLWPMWPHSSQPTHEYCGHKTVEGQSYCSKHYAKSIRSNDEPSETFVPHFAQQRKQAA